MEPSRSCTSSRDPMEPSRNWAVSCCRTVPFTGRLQSAVPRIRERFSRSFRKKLGQPRSRNGCAVLLRLVLGIGWLHRVGERFVCRFGSREFFNTSRPEFAEYIAEQGTITTADFLELHGHSQIVDEILNLSLDCEAHVEDVEHQA